MECVSCLAKPSEQESWCESLAVRTAATLLCALELLPRVQGVRSGKKSGLPSGNAKVTVCHYRLLQIGGV